MRVVNRIDQQRWKEFLDRNPRANIFHSMEMFQVFERTPGHRPSLWATVRDDGQVLALLTPVEVSLGGGPMRFLSTRAVAYGSALIGPGEEGQEALSLLLQTYNRRVSFWPVFTELRNLTDLSASQAVFQRHGYVYEAHLNYLLDLRRDVESILQSFSKGARSHIRTSLRRNVVTVKELTDRADISRFYEVLCKTYRAVRVPPPARSLIESGFEILAPKGMTRATWAFVEETPVAAQIALLYKDVIFGWYNGTDRSFGQYRPNEMLMWELIKWGAEHGYRVLDFGGAGKPNERYGVRDFKAKFNGELVNYARNLRVHSPWRMKISVSSYQLARKTLLFLDHRPAGLLAR